MFALKGFFYLLYGDLYWGFICVYIYLSIHLLYQRTIQGFSLISRHRPRPRGGWYLFLIKLERSKGLTEELGKPRMQVSPKSQTRVLVQ